VTTLPVWLYWEGACPDWIAACRRTICAHAPDVRLVTPVEFDQLRDVDRDIDLDALYVAHRADFIRAFLLARYGGLWVDADCLVLRRLEPVLELLTRNEFVGYQERQGHVANNFMGAPPGSRVAAHYYRRVCEILRTQQPLEWLTLGSYTLTETIRATNARWHRLGVELVQPVCWSQPGVFFHTAPDAEHARNFNDRAYAYMLSANMVGGYAAEHEGADLLTEGTFFRYLLRRADAVGARAQATRRSSMGTSNWQQIPFCVETLLAVEPARVLDVGIGFGRWGVLVREFCEEWKGRIHRENWRVHLEGIEAYPKNVEEYQHFFYDWIHVGDAAGVLARMAERWDLIICGDVLQQWPKETAHEVLARALDLADYVLVNSPLGAGWERGGVYGNPYEQHRSTWQLDELHAFEPIRHAVFNEYMGRDYGAFLFSRADPRKLRPVSQLERQFADIYRRNLWLDAESRSGPGSRLSQTANLRQALPPLLAELQATQLLDAPCGDFNWMRHVQLNGTEYVGGDVVPDLVARNRELYSGPRRRFITLDLTADALPRADVIMCRDCLPHLSFADALTVLANLRRSNAQYLLTTTYTERQENYDCATGCWRPLNLQRPPFNLPPPLKLINEGCTEGDGVLADKSLGLWRLADLP
jgi:hypothetical protein